MKKIRWICGAVILLSTCLIKQGEVEQINHQKIAQAKSELHAQKSDYDQQSLMIENLEAKIVKKIADRFDSTYRLDTLGLSSCVDLIYPYTIEDVYEQYPQYIDHFIPLQKAEISGRTTLDPKNESGYAKQTYFSTINLNNSWSLTKGENVTVAVIDTGIVYNHKEFYDANKNTIISDKSYAISLQKSVADSGGDYSILMDSTYHGTSVASMIAAQVTGADMVGTAADVDLMIIKAETNADLTFKNTYDLITGLSYAITNGADIINMSVQYYGSNIFGSYLATAASNGITVIGAAGNNGVSTNSYPSADKNCIGVGALDRDSLVKADYSNYGKNNTTVMAPGTYVYAAYHTSTSSYAYVTGTSFAAPIVSGVAALYKSLHPNANFTEIDNMFKISATDLGAVGYDTTYGYGVIDVDRMLSAEQGTLNFDFKDNGVTNVTQKFIRGRTLQILPATTSNNKSILGWYYDEHLTIAYEPGVDILNADLTLYPMYDATTLTPLTGINIKTETSISVGSKEQLVVTYLPSSASNKNVTWSSSNPSVATVQEGLVRGLSAGTATITATSEDGGYASTCTVTVTEATTAASVEFLFTTLSWGTSQDAWTSNKNGGAYDSARKAIQVTSGANGANATTKIDYTSVTSVVLKLGKSSSGIGNVAVMVGDTTLTPNNTNFTTTATEYTYSSLTPVSGKVKITVTCTTSSIYVYSAKINYQQSTSTIPVNGIALNVNNLDMKIGSTYTLVSTISPENATNKNMVYSSSNTSIVSTTNGLLTALSEGYATITATTEDGNYTATCFVVVTANQGGESNESALIYRSSFKNCSLTTSGYGTKSGFTLTTATENSTLKWGSGVAQFSASVFYQGHNSAANAGIGTSAYTNKFGTIFNNQPNMNGTYKNYLMMENSLSNAAGIKFTYSKADVADASGYIVYSTDSGATWQVGNGFTSLNTNGGTISFNFDEALLASTTVSLDTGNGVRFALIYSTSAGSKQRIYMEDIAISSLASSGNNAEQDAADAVINLIESIGTVTIENYTQKNASIQEAQKGFNALTASQKELVSNYLKLTEAQNKYEAYDFIVYYQDLRVSGDICWILNDAEEYDFVIGLYDLLEPNVKLIVDSYSDVDDISIGETIAYLKAVNSAKETKINSQLIRQSIKKDAMMTITIIGAIVIALTLIVIKKEKNKYQK